MGIVRFLAATRRSLREVPPLLRHAGVPFWLKAAAVLGALLIVSPIDVFGDIPVLGVLDDALLLALLVNGFVMVAGRYAVGAMEPASPSVRRAGTAVRRLR